MEPTHTVITKIEHIIAYAIVEKQYRKVHYMYHFKHSKLLIHADDYRILKVINILNTGVTTMLTLDPIHLYIKYGKDLVKAIFYSIQIYDYDLLTFVSDEAISTVVNTTIDGRAPLMFACINNHESMIVKLIQCGANVNTTFNKKTSFSWLIRNKYYCLL